MKKKLLIVLLLLLLATNLFATKETVPSQSKGLPIYAYMDSYCILKISEYASDSTDTIGMPFSITNANVKYNERDIKTGRLIGNWSFSTNENNLSITIEPKALTHTIDSTKKLDYYLTFMYEYYSSTGSLIRGYLVSSSKLNKTLNTTTSAQTKVTDFNSVTSNVINFTNDTSIISANKDIRIMFDSNYNVEDDNLFPIGSYEADVTITIIGGV